MLSYNELHVSTIFENFFVIFLSEFIAIGGSTADTVNTNAPKAIQDL